MDVDIEITSEGQRNVARVIIHFSNGGVQFQCTTTELWNLDRNMRLAIEAMRGVI